MKSGRWNCGNQSKFSVDARLEMFSFKTGRLGGHLSRVIFGVSFPGARSFFL